MEKWQEAKWYQEIYQLLIDEDKQLSKQEKKVLANALLLLKRQEPFDKVMEQLYQRLEWVEELTHKDVGQPPLQPDVAELYQKLSQYYKNKPVVIAPGVNKARPLWDDILTGQRPSSNESVLPGFPGTAFELDPSEAKKTIQTSFSKIDDKKIQKEAHTLGDSFFFWLRIYVGFIVVGFIVIFILARFSH